MEVLSDSPSFCKARPERPRPGQPSYQDHKDGKNSSIQQNVNILPNHTDDDLEVLVANVLSYFDKSEFESQTHQNSFDNSHGRKVKGQATKTFTDAELDDLVDKICAQNEEFDESSLTVEENVLAEKSTANCEKSQTPLAVSLTDTEHSDSEFIADDTENSPSNSISDCNLSINSRKRNVANAIEKLKLGGLEMVYSSGDDSSESDDDEPWPLFKHIDPSALLLSRPRDHDEFKYNVLDTDTSETFSSTSEFIPWDELDRRSEICLNIMKNLYKEDCLKGLSDSEDIINKKDNIMKCTTSSTSTTRTKAIPQPQEESVERFSQSVEVPQSSLNTLKIQKLKMASQNSRVNHKAAIERDCPKRSSQRSPDITGMVLGGNRRKRRIRSSNVRVSHISIPFFSFCNLVKQITYRVFPNRCSNLRYKASALNALHQATNAVLCGSIEDKYSSVLEASPFQNFKW